MIVGILNAFLVRGEYNYKLWILVVNTKGLLTTLRFIMLIIICLLLTFTTSSMNIAYGFGMLLRPLKRIGINEDEVLLMMMIALRYISALIHETANIFIAQKSRNINTNRINIKNNVKIITQFLCILITNCFHRANELSVAIESRCYNGNIGIKKYNNIKIQKGDFYCICVTLIIILLCVVTRFISH